MSDTTAPSPARPRRGPILPPSLGRVAFVGLSAFAIYLGVTLMTQWLRLRQETALAASGVVIGYVGIHPNLSFANAPSPWVQGSTDGQRLWAGWVKGKGHAWFAVNPGDLDLDRLTMPIGRDVFPAIDYPIDEAVGGPVADRVPGEAPVAGLLLDGVERAYPVLVLEKVCVVNDTVNGRALLVTHNPAGPAGPKIGVYEPVIAGQRLTLGHSGYYADRRPVLYDRGTESLWLAEGDTLRAVSGVHKGRTLKALAYPAPVTWSRWSGAHPAGRLVIGNDRARALPKL